MTKYTKEELTVYYNDEPVTMINQRLLEQQKRTMSDLIKIKELHVRRIEIESQMDQVHRQEDITYLFKEWTKVQRLLQGAWGFPIDDNWHPSHRLKQCSCGATMDNDERIGTPYKIITSGCPIHDPC